MKLKIIYLAILFCLLSTPILAVESPPTITWLGNGWLISAAYTNPAPVATTTLTFDATVNYEVDGVAQTTTATESITGTVPISTTKKIWNSKITMSKSYTIAEIAGDGTASYDSTGKLIFSVAAPNDGKRHTLTFKLLIIVQ